MRLREIVRALSLIGLDQVAGYFSHTALSKASQPLSTIRQIQPTELAGMRGDHTPVVIDVRHEGEWRGGHLPSAIHIPLGHLSRRLSELPKGQPLVMQCQSGSRSAIAASLLRRAGYEDVSNLAGGHAAWVKAGLPTVDIAVVTSYKLRSKSEEDEREPLIGLVQVWLDELAIPFGDFERGDVRGALKSSTPVPSRTAFSSSFKSIFDVTSMPAAWNTRSRTHEYSACEKPSLLSASI